jgi:hypothetical protein
VKPKKQFILKREKKRHLFRSLVNDGKKVHSTKSDGQLKKYRFSVSSAVFRARARVSSRERALAIPVAGPIGQAGLAGSGPPNGKMAHEKPLKKFSPSCRKKKKLNHRNLSTRK